MQRPGSAANASSASAGRCARKRASGAITARASSSVPSRQSSDSGFRRAPAHSGHASYERYFDSSTRTCIL